jgi:hypothetical protein
MNEQQKLESLSDSELDILIYESLNERTRRSNEIDALAKQKLDYDLVIPKPKFEYNYYKMFNIVKDKALEGILPLEDVDNAFREGTSVLSIKYNEVYPCPTCNNMSLEISDGECANGKDGKGIYCYNCDFSLDNRQNCYYSSDCWKRLHDWLFKHQYLSVNTYPKRFSDLDKFLKEMAEAQHESMYNRTEEISADEYE